MDAVNPICQIHSSIIFGKIRRIMEFIVNRQIAIEAESPEEALEKTKPSEGKTISFSVNPRPQPPQQAIRTPIGIPAKSA